MNRGYKHLFFAGTISFVISKIFNHPDLAFYFFSAYPMVLLVYLNGKEETK